MKPSTLNPFSSMQVHWDALTAAVERTEGDIDLLLTCDWPADVAAGLPANAGPPDGAAAGGSEPLSAIAVAVRPRCCSLSPCFSPREMQQLRQMQMQMKSARCRLGERTAHVRAHGACTQKCRGVGEEGAALGRQSGVICSETNRDPVASVSPWALRAPLICSRGK